MRHSLSQRLALPVRVALTCLLVAAGGRLVLAHLALTKSVPAKNTTVSSPAAIQVWFTQEPDLPLSSLKLTGPSGEVKLGTLEAGGAKSIKSAVDGTLAPGAYTVAWKTAGDDGHVLQGTFGFTVAAPTK